MNKPRHPLRDGAKGKAYPDLLSWDIMTDRFRRKTSHPARMGEEGSVSRIKLAIMGPFAAFVILLTLGVALAEYHGAKRETARTAAQIATAIERSFAATVATEAAGMQGIALTVLRDEGLKAAFLGRDRDRLYDSTRDLFAALKDANDITHFYFTDPERRNFLRVHQPERYDDVIGRATTLAAERTRSVSWGIELGPLGTLTLRMVVPWLEGDRLLGYVELGKEIERLFDGLRDRFDVHPLVFLAKHRLDRPGWESGMRMLGRPADWDEFDDTVLVIRNHIPPEVIRRFRKGFAESIQVDDRRFAWLRLNVPEAGGGSAADVGLVLDVTQRHRETARFGRTVAAVAILGSLVVLSLFWLVLGRIEATLARTQADLTEREARYHGMFEGCGAVQLLIDGTDGRIIEANSAAASFYGWTKENLAGMYLSEIDTASAEASAEEIRRIMGGEGVQVFFRHQLASGELRDVEMYSSPIVLGGKPLLYAIIHDITERRQAEAALQATTANLTLVLETAGEGIFGVDGEGRITFANAAAAEILGWPSMAEVQGMDCALAVGHLLDDRSACAAETCSIRATLGDGATRRVNDEYFMGPNGFLKPVEYVVSPIVMDGGIVGVVVVFHDITMRKQAEEALKRSNADLQQFAYVASHDLQAPLRTITSYLQLLEHRYKDKLDRDAHEFIDFTVGAAKNMTALIRDLLEFSRVDTKGKPLEPVAMDEVVQQALGNLRVVIADSEAKVTTGSFPAVRGDDIQLTRLIQNLIGNALKYRAPDRPPAIEVKAERDGDTWVFSVADNGIGIEPKYFDRIFQIFQRLHTAEEYEGTGIGLAVCKRIVERHGGSIWVESEPGRGSTFRFTLPAA